MPVYDKTIIKQHLAAADAGVIHAAKGRRVRKTSSVTSSHWSLGSQIPSETK